MSSPPVHRIKLTYFDMEGSGEPVRLAMTLAKIHYEDVRIELTEWGELKSKMPYRQLPVMEFDNGADGKLHAQSGAMLRYIGSISEKMSSSKTATYSLYPPEKLYDIEEAIGLLDDLNISFRPAQYMGLTPDRYGHHEKDWFMKDEGKKLIEKLRQDFMVNEFPIFMKYITEMLQRYDGDDKFIAGTEYPTIADCVAVPIIRKFSRGFLDYVPTTSLDGYPAVVNYIKRFCSLPEIAGRYNDGVGAI